MKFLWQCPKDADAALVLAHGAGADMTHRNMQALGDALGRKGIATLRFDFPFIEAGRRRVDSRAVATGSIAEACAEASRRTALPLWLGGHSFGFVRRVPLQPRVAQRIETNRISVLLV